MTRTTPYRVAIVGRNAAAGLAALAAARRARASGLESQVEWLQCERERAFLDGKNDKSSDKNAEEEGFLALPAKHDEYAEVFRDLWQVVDDPFLFVDGSRRTRMNVFLGSDAPGWHPAVRRRLVAASLWNDLSPSQWKKRWRGGFEPATDWMNSDALSLKACPVLSDWLRVAVISKRVAIQRLTELGEQVGVKVLHGERAVQAVQSVRGGAHRLILNPPFGHSSAEYVVWSSLASVLDEEGERSRRVFKASPFAFAGRWQSWGTWVDERAVTALPLFSVWLERGLASRFLDSGALEAGALKRVFAVPLKKGGSDKNRVWLQVQSLLLREMREDTREPDAFLWDHCPYLKAARGRWLPLHNEEDYFLADPTLHVHNYGKRARLMSCGSLGSMRGAIDAFLPKPPRKAKAPEATP